MEKMEVGRKHSGTSNNVQRGVFGLYLFAITVVKNALPFHLSELGRLTEKVFFLVMFYHYTSKKCEI